MLFFALSFVFIFAGQSWFQVSMFPNQDTVSLQEFDGYTAYVWLAPLLLVCLAVLAVSLLTTGRIRRITLFIGFLSCGLTFFLSVTSVLTKDLSGVSRQLEAATGIAVSHGVDGVEVQTQPYVFMSLVLLVFLTIGFFWAAILSNRWLPQQGKVARQGAKSSITSVSKSSSNDSIGLWDQQR